MTFLSRLATLVCTLGLVVAFAAADVSPNDIKRISSDPHVGDGAQHATQVEPDTFAWGNTVVAAFQVGRFATSPGGSSNVGWATSTDGGATWTHGFLPGLTPASTPAGPYERVSDPSVAYDALHGVWLITSLVISGSSPVAGVVSRSVDGLRWSTSAGVTGGGAPDKNWIVCDNWPTSPYRGRCYVAWSRSRLIVTSTSTDGGQTWGPARTALGSPMGWGVQPVIQPNGTLVVVYQDAMGNIAAVRSVDGAASFVGPVTVASLMYRPPASLRDHAFPSVEVDQAGKIYVAWSDCRFRATCSANDIVLSTSTDGVVWSSPLRVTNTPVDDTLDHFIPGLAVDPTSAGTTARLALTYYAYSNPACTEETCQLHVGFTSSADGGTTWSGTRWLNTQPMSLTWLPTTTQGRMVGDYISTSFANGVAVPVFALADPLMDGVFQQAMYAAAIPVQLTTESTATPTITTTPANTNTPTGTPTKTATPTPTETTTSTSTTTSVAATTTVTPTLTPWLTAPHTASPSSTPTPTTTASATHMPTPSVTLTSTPTARRTPMIGDYLLFMPYIKRGAPGMSTPTPTPTRAYPMQRS